MMVADVLAEGRDNAISGRDLCVILGINSRDLLAAVERERRNGAAICASPGGPRPGYYLARDRAEMERYSKSLYKRGSEIMATYRACKATAERLPEVDNEGSEGND